MNNEFHNRLNQLYDEDKEAFVSLNTIIYSGSSKKNEIILSPQKLCENIYIIQSGIIREYREDQDGKDISLWFSVEGDIIMDMKSFVLGVSGQTGLQAVEDCNYLLISRADVMNLVSKYHSIETFYRQLLELYFLEIEDRLYRMQVFNAKQNYEFLLKHKPHFLQRIPLNYIASFIGVTKETLSRIRKNIV